MKHYFLILVLICSSVTQVFAGTYSGGSGTQLDPYRISTTHDLIELSKTNTDWDKHFVQTTDITFNEDETSVDWDGDESATWDSEDQLGFSSIGNNPYSFSGQYDGATYEIRNLFIDRSSSDFVGFIGYLQGSGKIINLGLVDSHITGNNLVGSFVGYIEGTVVNCYATGNIIGNNDVGGFVGRSIGSTISMSNTNCFVEGLLNIGGFVGWNSSSLFNKCYSSGKVSGNENVGGFVGWHQYDTPISNSYSTSIVNGSGNKIGGFAGYSWTGAIEQCFSTGSVEGNEHVGGFSGGFWYASIINCYSISSVNGVANLGGFAGSNGYTTINNCYSSGSVIGDQVVGGFIGSNAGGTINDSFWDINTSGQSLSAGGSGKTSDQMKTIITFTNSGWDFDTTWNISIEYNDSYPYLQNIYEEYFQKPYLIFPIDFTLIYDNNVNFKWSKVKSATNYQIQVSENEDFAITINDLVTTETSIIIDLLSTKKTYYWRVRSINSVDTSEWSSVWSFKTIFKNSILKIGTGYNSITDSKLEIGSRDKCWQVIQVPEFYNLEVPYDAYITYNGGWYSNPPQNNLLPDCFYLTPLSNGESNGNEPPELPVIFEKRFFVKGNGEVSFFGEFLTDNFGKLLLDTVLITHNLDGNHDENFKTPKLFDKKLFLNEGMHSLFIHLINAENHIYQPLGARLNSILIPVDTLNEIEIIDDNCNLDENDSDYIWNNGPICAQEDIQLFSKTNEGATYNWSGPNNFYSNEQNPKIRKATQNHSGIYSMYYEKNGIKSKEYITEVRVMSPDVDPGDSSLVFAGSARRMDKFLRLNNSVRFDRGSIWLKRKFSIKKDFSTSFKFRFSEGSNGEHDKETSLPGADGIAFIFQNNDYPSLGDAGGSIGYRGIPYSLAIEYDTYHNDYDPNGNHIAIQSMGNLPNTENHTEEGLIAMNDTIITFRDNVVYHSKITYDYTSRTIFVYLDSTGDFIEPVLKVNDLDLSNLLELEDGEFVYIGFSGATGSAYENHDILEWLVPCDNLVPSSYKPEDFTETINQTSLMIYPNPCTENSKIRIMLAEPEIISISIKDILGMEIQSIVEDKFLTGGIHEFNFATDKLISGVYFVYLESKNKVIVEKLIK